MSSRLKKLSPKSINPKDIGEGGGPPDITPQDVAAALAGLPSLHYLYALHAYVYLGEEYARSIEAQASRLKLMVRMTMFIQSLGFEYKKAQKFAAVVLQTMHDGSVCTHCNGHGVVFDDHGKHKECGRCKGSKKLRYSASGYAKLAGVSKTVWWDEYKQDFWKVNQEVWHLKNKIRLHVEWELSDPDEY